MPRLDRVPLERRPTLSEQSIFWPNGTKMRSLPFLGLALVQEPPFTKGKPLAEALGLPTPIIPNTVVTAGQVYWAWLGPGRWLLSGDEGSVHDAAERARRVLPDSSGLVVLISDARCALQLAGPSARSAIASHCPLDLHPRAFAPGRCAQSLLGETGVFVHQVDTSPTFIITVDRTAASYAWELLSGSIVAEAGQSALEDG